MKPLTSRLVCVLWGFLVGGVAPAVLAESQPNPYQAIIERNPFGLKPPPPPPDPTPVAPAVPMAKVVLTGITTMFGGPRALLEVTDQEVGKAPVVRRPILHEGDRDGSIEVILIDVDKSLVKIRNAGIETNVFFETPKIASGAPAVPVAPAGFHPNPLIPPGTPGLPSGFSPPNPAAVNNPARSGVTVFGNPGSASPAAPRAGVPGTYSGFGPPGTPATGAPITDSTGLRSIPTRTLRTDSSGRVYPPPVPAQ